jgi:hypothetical protein
MDPISPFNPVLDALRRQVAENIERLRKSGKLAAGARGDRTEQAGARGEGLESVLRRKISALDRRSPEARAQAARLFVETVLVAEFGEALLSDPGLGDLLSEVGASLSEDPQLREQLDRALAEIQAGA